LFFRFSGETVDFSTVPATAANLEIRKEQKYDVSPGE